MLYLDIECSFGREVNF